MIESFDWSGCAALEQVPGKVGGAWVFRGTRVPLWAVLNSLKDIPATRIEEDYPALGAGQVETVLDFIASRAESPSRDALAA